MKHPHAEFIAEALKDMSRKIEVKDWPGSVWSKCELIYALTATHETTGAQWKFRFADTKPECVSPLTEKEFDQIYWDALNQHVREQDKKTIFGYAQAIANAAHRAAIKQVTELPAVTSLSRMQLLREYDSVEDRANAAIAEFQQTLLKQLGE
jgi:hypothetical protein